MKKKLLKTTITEKLEKVTKKLHINPNKKSIQPIGYPDARKTISKS